MTPLPHSRPRSMGSDPRIHFGITSTSGIYFLTKTGFISSNINVECNWQCCFIHQLYLCKLWVSFIFDSAMLKISELGASISKVSLWIHDTNRSHDKNGRWIYNPSGPFDKILKIEDNWKIVTSHRIPVHIHVIISWDPFLDHCPIHIWSPPLKLPATLQHSTTHHRRHLSLTLAGFRLRSELGQIVHGNASPFIIRSGNPA